MYVHVRLRGLLSLHPGTGGLGPSHPGALTSDRVCGLPRARQTGTPAPLLPQASWGLPPEAPFSSPLQQSQRVALGCVCLVHACFPVAGRGPARAPLIALSSA